MDPNGATSCSLVVVDCVDVDVDEEVMVEVMTEDGDAGDSAVPGKGGASRAHALDGGILSVEAEAAAVSSRPTETAGANL